MKKITGICAVLLSISAVVNSNTYASPSHPDSQWQGIYIGGHLGGVWNDIDWRFIQPNYFNTLGLAILGNDFDHNDSNFNGGGHIGFNYQINHWLLGIEGAITDVNLKDSIPSPYFPTLDTFSSEVNWYSTLVARLGYEYHRWLVFVTGGWAMNETELTLYSTTNVQAHSKFRSNGWTAGAGIEYKLLPCLMIGLSYEYIDIDHHDKAITCSNCGVGVGLGTPLMNMKSSTQTVSARLSYLFNI